MKETESGTIDLSEDDPEAVEHMVNYLYHLDYLTKPISRRTSRRSSSPLAPRHTAPRPKKFSLAMVEDPLLAMATAAAPVPDPLTPPAEHINAFEAEKSAKFPHTPIAGPTEESPFDHAQLETEGNAEKPSLLVHARVYEIAERYGIAGLKSLARTKFAHQLELHYGSAEFPEACQEAYESTVDSDRGLRDVIIQTFRAHPDLTLRKDVEQSIRQTPGLAFELFRMASGLPVTS
jgi:hypothetical protein